MVSLGGSRSKSNNSSESTVWNPQAAFLQDLYGEAQGAYDAQKNRIEGAMGSTLDQMMPDAIRGWGETIGRGQDFVGSQGMEWLGNTLGQNPYLEDAIGASQQGIYDNLERYGLPQDRTNAQMAGQAGSSRQGIAEGLRMAEADKQAANVASQMRQQDLARQQQAAQSMNQSNLNLYGLQNQGVLGGLNAMSGLLQNTIAPQMASWLPLQNYAQVVGAPTKTAYSSGSSKSNSLNFGIGM
jgi:hypothetical protein